LQQRQTNPKAARLLFSGNQREKATGGVFHGKRSCLGLERNTTLSRQRKIEVVFQLQRWQQDATNERSNRTGRNKKESRQQK
jgi:hypothetical protein